MSSENFWFWRKTADRWLSFPHRQMPMLWDRASLRVRLNNQPPFYSFYFSSTNWLINKSFQLYYNVQLCFVWRTVILKKYVWPTKSVIFTAVIFTALVKYCKMPQNGSSAPGTSKLNRSHHHHLDKLEMNGGKSMLCWWLKIAFHVSRSICHLGLFQGGGISISSHLQVIVTVEQFAECVCVLWRCGTSQGLYTYG